GATGRAATAHGEGTRELVVALVALRDPVDVVHECPDLMAAGRGGPGREIAGPAVGGQGDRGPGRERLGVRVGPGHGRPVDAEERRRSYPRGSAPFPGS